MFNKGRKTAGTNCCILLMVACAVAAAAGGDADRAASRSRFLGMLPAGTPIHVLRASTSRTYSNGNGTLTTEFFLPEAGRLGTDDTGRVVPKDSFDCTGEIWYLDWQGGWWNRDQPDIWWGNWLFMEGW